MRVLFSNCAFVCLWFFFFNDTATTEIYTLSLHDALPISLNDWTRSCSSMVMMPSAAASRRSEEHTSELQSHDNLVCRLLLEKKEEKTDEVTASRLGLVQPPRDGTSASGYPRRHVVAFYLLFFFLQSRLPPSSPPLPCPRLFR